MGIRAIYPVKKTTMSNKEHRKFPYLLENQQILWPNHVWATDITYVRMQKGFLSLTAVLDWYSRYVLSWRLSNTLDTSFCLEALDEALATYPRPETFNSDQGCQYSSDAFTSRLLSAGIKPSMAGRGRCYDNNFTEWLWRTLKQEEIYLKSYASGSEAHKSLLLYLRRYNELRPHQSLNYKTPQEVYLGISTHEQFIPEGLPENALRFPQAQQGKVMEY